MGSKKTLGIGALIAVGGLVVGTSVGGAAAPPKPAGLAKVGVFDSGSGAAGAEIVAYDAATWRMFVTNGVTNQIDVVALDDPAKPVKVGAVDLSAFGSGVQGVAVKDGLGIAAVAGNPVTANGKAVFFDASTLEVLRALDVGALPDMVTFTPKGDRALLANEAEPRCVDANGVGVTNPALATNPVGSVSIIDLRRGLDKATVRTAGFEAYNGEEATLQAQGVRVGTWPGASVAQDIEPEYIAVDPNGRTAYVTLQENNAVATIDLATAKVTAIKGLGLVDHRLPENTLDASDRDNAFREVSWPVSGMYMPDAITAWKAKGRTYVATANEGDSREYFANEANLPTNPNGSAAPLCFLDEARVRATNLDPVTFPDATFLRDNVNMGRLKVTKFFPSTYLGGPPPTNGTDPSSVPGLLYTGQASYGARSMAVWDTEGGLVANTGSLLERTVYDLDPTGWLQVVPPWATDIYDSRSDDKGPEPEAVVVAKVDGRQLAFLGLERAGGIMTFDITDPANPVFLDWARTPGAISPEGLTVVPAADSPTGCTLVLGAFEISGSTVIYQLTP